MRDVNKKFSVRYFLNLVLVDEEDRRYFKQQVRSIEILLQNYLVCCRCCFECSAHWKPPVLLVWHFCWPGVLEAVQKMLPCKKEQSSMMDTISAMIRMLSAIEQPCIVNIQTKHFVGK